MIYANQAAHHILNESKIFQSDHLEFSALALHSYLIGNSEWFSSFTWSRSDQRIIIWVRKILSPLWAHGLIKKKQYAKREHIVVSTGAAAGTFLAAVVVSFLLQSTKIVLNWWIIKSKKIKWAFKHVINLAKQVLLFKDQQFLSLIITKFALDIKSDETLKINNRTSVFLS